MNKYKKITIIILIIIFTILVTVFLRANKTKNSKSFFQNTVPLLNQTTSNEDSNVNETIYPPINPPKTNYEQSVKNIANKTSEIEKDKMVDDLPIYIENFATGTKINTTINVFSLSSDPPTSVRIEIYGPNYNNTGLLSEDAKAFKVSFEEIKKSLKDKKVNLNNLQIIYGNRQYIQDTATLWVKEFDLLD